MADSKNSRELNELLKQQGELQTRLNEQVKAAAVLSGREAQEMENKIASTKILLGLTEEEAKKRQKALDQNEKRQAKIRQMQCREQHITGKPRTCPNKSPLKWHGGKSHAALKSMAGDVKHCITNIRIVRIQRVANTRKNNRKSYAE